MLKITMSFLITQDIYLTPELEFGVVHLFPGYSMTNELDLSGLFEWHE